MFSVERTLVVWCPDWPVAATKASLAEPVAVMEGSFVMATSPAARREGVKVGLRRREAQSRCPELLVIDREPGAEARAFEPLVTTVEALAPRVEVMEPGCCAVPTRGPSRYFGGDEALVGHITMLVEEAARSVGVVAKCCVGVADGIFAATLAARASMVVPVGKSTAFLEPQPIDVLNRRELVDLLKRLGIRTLGDFSALPVADVLGRFGDHGVDAHRLASGLDIEPFHPRIPPIELSVEMQLDPPVQRVDTAAFAARALSERLQERLNREGLACNRLVIQAITEHGESLSRTWRHDGRLSAAAIGERVRWQLDGWLKQEGDAEDDIEEATAGITLLRLVPEGLLPDNGSQLGFWGGSIDADERTGRALARVQGLLGEEGVVTAVLGGGRSPADQVRFVPWGVAREPERPGHPHGMDDEDAMSALQPSALRALGKKSKVVEIPPWPGRLPQPAPATVYIERPNASVVDEERSVVTVDGRGVISADPMKVSIDGGPWQTITGWTGPWLVDERWWDASARHRSARLQIVIENGDAMLMTLEKGSWWVEALYD